MTLFLNFGELKACVPAVRVFNMKAFIFLAALTAFKNWCGKNSRNVDTAKNTEIIFMNGDMWTRISNSPTFHIYSQLKSTFK